MKEIVKSPQEYRDLLQLEYGLTDLIQKYFVAKCSQFADPPNK